MKWVLLTKFAEETGYTEAAVRQKIQRGDFVKGVHWRHSPDKRVQINLEAYEQWVLGLKPELHQEARAA
jgi:hypothetical protein